MTFQNKDHWYDGWFYDTVIAPNQDRMFGQIREMIAPDSTVIDIGCGTGRFSFFIAEHCATAIGIDISKRNIDRANAVLSRKPNSKISFRHSGPDSVIIENDRYFDYAVMTYILHEVDEDRRVRLLRDASRLARTVIIGDYLVPQQAGFWNVLNEMVEYAAGRDHYRNYKHFVSNGGILALIRQAGLHIVREVHNNPSTSHIVMANRGE